MRLVTCLFKLAHASHLAVTTLREGAAAHLVVPHTDGWESASLREEEEEEDGEWVDVHHSSDEEQQAIVSPHGLETVALASPRCQVNL